MSIFSHFGVENRPSPYEDRAWTYRQPVTLCNPQTEIDQATQQQPSTTTTTNQQTPAATVSISGNPHGSLLIAPTAKLNIAAGAKLYVETGASLVLEDGASLNLSIGTSLEVHSGQKLIVKANGQLTLKDKAEIIANHGDIVLGSNTTTTLSGLSSMKTNGSGTISIGSGTKTILSNSAYIGTFDYAIQMPSDMGDIRIGDNNIICLSGESGLAVSSGQLTTGSNAKIRLSDNSSIRTYYGKITLGDKSITNFSGNTDLLSDPYSLIKTIFTNSQLSPWTSSNNLAIDAETTAKLTSDPQFCFKQLGGYYENISIGDNSNIKITDNYLIYLVSKGDINIGSGCVTDFSGKLVDTEPKQTVASNSISTNNNDIHIENTNTTSNPVPNNPPSVDCNANTSPVRTVANHHLQQAYYANSKINGVADEHIKMKKTNISPTAPYNTFNHRAHHNNWNFKHNIMLVSGKPIILKQPTPNNTWTPRPEITIKSQAEIEQPPQQQDATDKEQEVITSALIDYLAQHGFHSEKNPKVDLEALRQVVSTQVSSYLKAVNVKA